MDFSKTGGISSEEEEIRLINQRILEARKRKEARLEAARLKEIEHLAERNRLAKERKQLEAELLAEKKLLKQKRLEIAFQKQRERKLDESTKDSGVEMGDDCDSSELQLQEDQHQKVPAGFPEVIFVIIQSMTNDRRDMSIDFTVDGQLDWPRRRLTLRKSLESCRRYPRARRAARAT